ncbi:ATP-binding protein [Streptosporangium saharense]|uniref:ATP-binding protein n=1 Tax=Streptosporangium saharense TaxID=1706840 RepID=UPI0034497A48
MQARISTLETRLLHLGNPHGMPVRVARLAVVDALGEDHPAYENVRLVVSELVTNAVRHGPQNGRVALCIRREESDFYIEVADDGTEHSRPTLHVPSLDEVDDPAEGGRGLWTVHVLSLGRWGFREQGSLRERVVWAYIPAHPRRP